MAGYDYDSHGPMPPYHYNDAPPPGYHSRRPPRRRESDYPEYPMDGPPPSWDAPPRGSHSWRGKGRKGRDGHTSSRRPDSHVEGFYDLDTTDSAQNCMFYSPPFHTPHLSNYTFAICSLEIASRSWPATSISIQ